LIWLAGALVLGIYICANNFSLLRIIRRERSLTDQRILDLLEDCKAEMGIRTILGVVATDKVKSACLFGFVRPRLLLPKGMIEVLNREELRYVFLHELGHLKRHDIWLGWLMSILQVLHWFNPFVWLAFYGMRADRELACDALVLSRTESSRAKEYGRIIVSLLERFSQARRLPAMAGILETKSELKRRITMIAQFKKNSYRWSPLAVALIIILGCVSLPDAKRTKAADATAAKPTPGAGAGSGPIVKTVYSGKDTAAVYGVLARDESTIATIDRSEKGGGISLRDLRTGETRTLESTKGHGWGWLPIWSADSKLIAYWWEEQNQESLRIVSRDGGEPRIIKSFKDGRFDPQDWSQDGKLLVGRWTQRGQVAKPTALATVDVATGVLHVLGPEGPHARISPDGRFVVCERTVDGNRDVFVVNIDGAQTTRITDSPAEDGCPIFSADGRFVLFSSNRRSNRPGAWDLWAIKVENGRPVGAVFPVKYDFGPHSKRITATGKLAFRISGGVTSEDVYEVQATRSVPGDEAQPKALAKASFGCNFYPAWSLDGKKVAYIRHRGAGEGHQLLCVLSLADGVEETFDPGIARFNRMFWSPDGQTIALFGLAEGRGAMWGLYLFSLATRGRVADHIQADPAGWALGFSADGKEFIFIAEKERVAVDLTTRAQRRISSPEELTWLAGAEDFNFSRDEALVAYVAKEGAESQLVVADADGRNKRVVVRVHEPATIMTPRWSPDSTKVAYYVTHAETGWGRHQLHVCAADGSWERSVNTGEKYVHNATLPPSWSADSTKVALTLVEDVLGEISLMENFLPAEK